MSVVLITGASRGIGAATARIAARDGWDVVVNYAGNEAAAKSVAAEIKAAGRRAVIVKGDVANPADVDAMFAAADTLGSLKGLVNNAGIGMPASRVEETNADRLARLWAVNITGSFLCAAAAIKRMSTRHGGAGGNIVNVGSAASKIGGPGVYVDYAASKGAIDTFTIGLAQEVAAEGIRVNAVRPGIIDTDIHQVTGDPGRAGTAEEVAEAIVWLLSDKSPYTTGSTITIGGGRGVTP